MRNRNNNLDVLRGLAVLFVVFMHIKFPGVFGAVCSDLGNLCNALFFLLSGYFALNNSQEKVIKKAIKCLMFTLGTYFGYVMIYSCGPKDFVFNLVYYLPRLIIANVAFCSNMWFAVALVYCYLIYSLIGEMKYRYILLGLLVFYVINPASMGIYRNIFSTITYGIPLFFLGNYIAQKRKDNNFSPGNNIIWISLLVGLILNFSDVIDADKFYSVNMLGGVVYALACFLWAVYAPSINVENKIIKLLVVIGRKFYLWFYVFQYFTIEFVKSTFEKIQFEYVDYLLPFIVIILLFIESVVIDVIIQNAPKVYKYLKDA